MKTRSINWFNFFLVFFLFFGISPAACLAGGEVVNLLSLQEGAFPHVIPPTYGGWDAENLLDDSPETGWACETGKVKDNVFVFTLVETATLDRMEFDTASADADAAGAKDVLVEVSTTSATVGFTPVLHRPGRQGEWAKLSGNPKDTGSMGAAHHPDQPRQCRME